MAKYTEEEMQVLRDRLMEYLTDANAEMYNWDDKFKTYMEGVAENDYIEYLAETWVDPAEREYPD